MGWRWSAEGTAPAWLHRRRSRASSGVPVSLEGARRWVTVLFVLSVSVSVKWIVDWMVAVRPWGSLSEVVCWSPRPGSERLPRA